MSHLLGYLHDPEGMDELAAGRLQRIVRKYPWFATARLLFQKANGKDDPLVQLHFTGRPMPSALLERPTEAHFLGGDTLSVISRFLGRPAKTLPTEEVSEGNMAVVRVEKSVDLVTEELAEIYLAQDLCEQAKAIYERLSLLNPEKSIYFAELIGRIDVDIPGE